MSESKTLPAKSETSRSVQRAPFSSFRREMERLFDDFDDYVWPSSLRRSWLQARPPLQTSMTVPAVDVTEKDSSFEITAELPGMEEKDVEVTLANDALMIRGEKKAEKEEKKKDYYLRERSYGSFERYFGLPDGVATDKVSASFKNGVLTVTLPKTRDANSGKRQIPIQPA